VEALAVMSKTHVWLGGEVREQRDLPLLRRLGVSHYDIADEMASQYLDTFEHTTGMYTWK
jgi:hypothetical protein